MDKHPAILILGLNFIIVIAAFVAFCGGSHGAKITVSFVTYSAELSVFVFCTILAFLLNWICYLPAMIYKTEHYYDLVGSITYLLVIAVALLLVPNVDWRAIIVSTMVIVWALRLGAFLFIRVRVNGADDRFDEVKIDPLKFLVAWTLQALWVVLTVACALVIIASDNSQPFDALTVIGVFLWCLGFVVEVVADKQKSEFRRKPENKDNFINSGLWAWSQHPNYFGEIVLWFGMALIAIPVLEAWQWFVLISPFFVCLLLTKGSGIPTLEEKAQIKWADNDAYQDYIKETGVLFPVIFKK